MKNLRMLFLILLIILIGKYFAITIKKFPQQAFSFKDIGIAEVPETFTTEVYGVHSVGQVFLCNFSNLHRIGFFISKNTRTKGDLIFRLKESISTKDDLIKVIIPAGAIKQNLHDFYQSPPDPISKSGVFYYINFKPLKDSKDKFFYFSLESPDSSLSNGYRVGFRDSNDYIGLRQGNAHVDSKLLNGNLAFQTKCLWIGDFRSVMNEMKDNFFRDKGFAIFYLSSIAVLVLGIVVTSFLKFRM